MNCASSNTVSKSSIWILLSHVRNINAGNNNIHDAINPRDNVNPNTEEDCKILSGKVETRIAIIHGNVNDINVKI